MGDGSGHCWFVNSVVIVACLKKGDLLAPRRALFCNDCGLIRAQSFAVCAECASNAKELVLLAFHIAVF
jgi:hypothetical protein